MASRSMIALAVLVAAGCTSSLPRELAPDYNRRKPGSIGVVVESHTERPLALPARSIFQRLLPGKSHDSVEAAFRQGASQTLRAKGYRVILYRRDTGEGGTDRTFVSGRRTSAQVTESIGADSLLLVSIKEWDVAEMLARKTVYIRADCVLIEGTTGKTLWRYDSGSETVRIESHLDSRDYRGYIDRFFGQVFKTLP